LFALHGLLSRSGFLGLIQKTLVAHRAKDRQNAGNPSCIVAASGAQRPDCSRCEGHRHRVGRRTKYRNCHHFLFLLQGLSILDSSHAKALLLWLVSLAGTFGPTSGGMCSSSSVGYPLNSTVWVASARRLATLLGISFPWWRRWLRLRERYHGMEADYTVSPVDCQSLPGGVEEWRGRAERLAAVALGRIRWCDVGDNMWCGSDLSIRENRPQWLARGLGQKVVQEGTRADRKMIKRRK
jgi:hypothetical protein